MTKHVVTGGAGFIGSHLTDKLLEMGNEVAVIDNLSTGKKEFLGGHMNNPKFSFVKKDLLNDDITEHLKESDCVWHMAANPDVKVGAEDTRVHLEQNIIATYNVLEAARKAGVRLILFPSTSTIYGEAEKKPTPEDYGPLKPISLYGASKLACESLISAYCHTFGMKGWIFRLANVIGPRSTHGVIYDFINKLRKNPGRLEILGDGTQKKSYMHVADCIDAMLLLKEKAGNKINIFNVGIDEWITVKRIAEIVCKEMGLSPAFGFTGGDRGWKGDVPKMLLSTDRLKETGWKPKYNSQEAIRDAIRSLL